MLVAVCMIVPCAAQTLREALHQAGIPSNSFSIAELAQTINAASAARKNFTYLVYMRVGKNDLLSGFPQIIRYDSRDGVVIRRQLEVNEGENCCGSPSGIDFTHNFLLISFHDNPSAATMLVVDSQLHLIEILYGFDFHEIAPDQVVFIENMIHFAAQHPERLRFVDLRSGRTQELYPPKGDALRAEFARVNQEHMPTQAACRQANDPCEPNIFDETIRFISTKEKGSFEIQVDRNVSHPWVTHGQMENDLTASSIYAYRVTNKRWLYCETALSADPSTGQTIHHENAKSCTPNLPVAADTSGQTSPFPAIVRKVKSIGNNF